MSTQDHSSDEGKGSHGSQSGLGDLQSAGEGAGVGRGQISQQAALEWLTAALASTGAVDQPAAAAQLPAESQTLPPVSAGIPATTVAATAQDPVRSWLQFWQPCCPSGSHYRWIQMYPLIRNSSHPKQGGLRCTSLPHQLPKPTYN